MNPLVLDIPTAESLLDGTPSTALSPQSAASLSASRDEENQQWENARKMADLAKNLSRAGTAAKALCGLQLITLRERYYGPRSKSGGRPKKPEAISGFASWDEMVAEKVGVTDRTARTWMSMGDSVASIAAQQGMDIQEIITKLPWDWTTQEAEILEATVTSITEGKSAKDLLALQSDFLSDLGVEKGTGKKSSGGSSKGRKTPAANPLTLLEERQAAARLLIYGSEKAGTVEKGSIFMSLNRWAAGDIAEVEALPKPEAKAFYDILKLAAESLKKQFDL